MRDYITNYELNNMLAKGWKVIDVRSEYELTYLKKFPEAVNIPYPKIIEKKSELFPDKNVRLIMLCNAGNRSGVAARNYRQDGYKNVYVLMGGIEGLDL